MNKNLLKALGLSVALMSSAAQAMTLDWSGGYRFEWTEVDRPTLGTPGGRKAYGLNSLYLSPKIIAADGVNVISRFDVLNSYAYSNTQMGEIWGLNLNSEGAAASNNQGSSELKVSQLYLNVNQEYGSLIVGRAPFEFGLGMTYSAGTGAFDHFYDTRDMVAYKIVVGDWFFMPILGRKQSSDFGQGGTLTTMGAQLQYKSEANRTMLGVFVENTKGAKSVLGYKNATDYDGDGFNNDMSVQRTNFAFGRDFDAFGFKLEAGFASGETGVTSGANSVKMNGYGIATELYIPRGESKWDWKLKMGVATGDDGNSTDFGTFSFNRNYDVAMLLFNHRLGQRDFLGTNYMKDTTNLSVGNSADDEAVSNTMYFAPSVNYAWNERVDVRNTLIYGQLMNAVKNSVDSSKDLGLEWDIEVVYKPSERIQWVNQIGLLAPGAAFKNGSDDLETSFNYGFASKAAISF